MGDNMDYMGVNGLDLYQEEFKKMLNIPTGGGKGKIPSAKRLADIQNRLGMYRLWAFRENMQKIDAMEAIARFDWEDLPTGLTPELMERICYFKGQGILFWEDIMKKWLLLPFTFDGDATNGLDFYGAYGQVRPVPFNGVSEQQKVFLSTIKRKPVYSIEEAEELKKRLSADEIKKEYCVILRDYSRLLNFNIVPLYQSQRVYIDMVAEIIPMIRSILLRGAMPKLVHLQDEGMRESAEAGMQSLYDAILIGKPYTFVTGFGATETIGDNPEQIEEYFKAFESANNMRKSGLGIPSDGTFKKGERMIVDEQKKNQQATLTLLDNSYDSRKLFRDIVNTLFEELDIKVFCDTLDEAESETVVDEKGENNANTQNTELENT